MILSDNDIKAFIKSGDIVIKPYNESNLKPASYTFTLGKIILKPLPVALIDPEHTEVKYEEITMGENGYTLSPGEFVLGQLSESLSISERLCCMLDARGSLARLGLNVLQASTLTEPGQTDSHETLEINNIGTSPIKIYPGLKVVKGVFAVLHTPASQKYSGKYAGQKHPGKK